MAEMSAERPAPPPGVEVLTVPEAQALSVRAAEERGEPPGQRRAIITKQDIARELRRGGSRGLIVGEDAWWVVSPAHPSRGYWVLSQAAVERRIQQRLMGSGRPRRPRPEKEEVTAPAPAQSAVEEAIQDPVTAPPAVEVSGQVEEEPPLPLAPPVAAAMGGRGPLAWPVLDPDRYHTAVRRAMTDGSKHLAGILFVCRSCGWSGLDGEFTRQVRAGGGWDDVCPGCGTIRRALEGDIGYVPLVAKELRHLEQQVQEEAKRTRNAAWVTRLRGHLRHLALLASQAQLEEEVTSGVVDQVASLKRHIEEMLGAQVVLPANMRNQPGYEVMRALVEPRVRQAVERMLSPLRLAGDRPADIPGDPTSLVRGILAGTVPPAQAVSAIQAYAYRRGLDEHGQVGRLVGVINRQAGQLGLIPDADLRQAIIAETEIERARRRGESWHEALREWAGREAQNRHLWERHRQVIAGVHTLREDLTNLLSIVAQAEVEERVATEVDRLTTLAMEEAQRRGRQPIEVAASWVRSTRSPIPAELRDLVAYPLAQRLSPN